MKADEIRRRREQALRLRTGGMTYAAIAEQEVRGTARRPRAVASVARDVELALAERLEMPGGERGLKIALELERLDSLQRAAAIILQAEQSGRCPQCGRTDNPAAVVRAGQLIVKVAERRSALEGLDADKAMEAPPAGDPVDRLRAAVGSNVTPINVKGPNKRGPRRGSGL